jgi:uncharacterized membrane protein
MRFELPWALVAVIPVIGIVWWVAMAGRRSVPRRQHRWAVVARILGAALLIVALAQPLAVTAVEDRIVLYLVDRSDSIGQTARDVQNAYLEAAATASDGAHRWGVAVFGADVRVDQALHTGITTSPIGATIDPAATDLATALRSAAALLPSAGSRRIVVLSDMVETGGDAREAMAELEELGVAVDVVPLESSRGPDAIVATIDLPATVRVGETVPVAVAIRSNTAGPATVTIRVPGLPDEVRQVTLEAGTTVIETEIPATEGGNLPVEVTVDAPFDTRDANDTAVGLTRVVGAARVAVVEGVTGDADEVAAALEAGGVTVDRAVSLPDETALLAYDGVVLVNVTHPTAEEGERLTRFVEDLGRGLVVVGGDRAYGLGDYQDTPLEALLPVTSDPDELVRRQPVAEVLVLDTSGSMADCHCSTGTEHMIDEDGTRGFPKTDIAALGAELAIEALSDQDRVGVLAFSSGFDWVIPLAQRPDPATVSDALGGLLAGGDTEIAVALEEALAQLADAPEQLRHIVLFTDGWDPNDANLVPIARRIADAGVTLSVLGTGEGSGATLRRMAQVGGGRFYPGTDLEAVPEVFVEETLTVARNLANEGSFLPALGAPSPATENLAAAPPLLGYVLTKAKGTASVALEIGEGDPLLASWQRGLGRVTAWTSDATSRWSAAWVDWDGYVEFWGAVVGDVLPSDQEPPPQVVVDDGAIVVALERDDLTDQSQAIARITSPDGTTTAVPLTRTGPDRFVGEVTATSPGAYAVAVTVEDGVGGSVTTSSGAVSSFEQEFAFREPDPSLAEAIATATGGRVDPSPEETFEPAPTRGSAERSLWPILVGIALALFMIDVALRRLVLTAGDAEAWRQAVRSEASRERARVEAVTAARATSPDMAREVVSDSETLQRLMRRKQR